MTFLIFQLLLYWCAKRVLHSIEIDKVEAYKLSAFCSMFYDLQRAILGYVGWHVHVGPMNSQPNIGKTPI